MFLLAHEAQTVARVRGQLDQTVPTPVGREERHDQYVADRVELLMIVESLLIKADMLARHIPTTELGHALAAADRAANEALIARVMSR